MKRAWNAVVGFFHKHPAIKTTVVGALGAAVTSAAAGTFGAKAAAVAGAVTAVYGLFVKRPQDGVAEQKSLERSVKLAATRELKRLAEKQALLYPEAE